MRWNARKKSFCRKITQQKTVFLHHKIWRIAYNILFAAFFWDGGMAICRYSTARSNPICVQLTEHVHAVYAKSAQLYHFHLIKETNKGRKYCTMISRYQNVYNHFKHKAFHMRNMLRLFTGVWTLNLSIYDYDFVGVDSNSPLELFCNELFQTNKCYHTFSSTFVAFSALLFQFTKTFCIRVFDYIILIFIPLTFIFCFGGIQNNSYSQLKLNAIR